MSSAILEIETKTKIFQNPILKPKPIPETLKALFYTTKIETVQMSNGLSKIDFIDQIIIIIFMLILIRLMFIFLLDYIISIFYTVLIHKLINISFFIMSSL